MAIFNEFGFHPSISGVNERDEERYGISVPVPTTLPEDFKLYVILLNLEKSPKIAEFVHDFERGCRENNFSSMMRKIIEFVGEVSRSSWGLYQRAMNVSHAIYAQFYLEDNSILVITPDLAIPVPFRNYMIEFHRLVFSALSDFMCSVRLTPSITPPFFDFPYRVPPDLAFSLTKTGVGRRKIVVDLKCQDEVVLDKKLFERRLKNIKPSLKINLKISKNG